MADIEPEVTAASAVMAEEPATDEQQVREWNFVTQWRDGGEPVPWAPGLALAGMITLISAIATWVLGAGFTGRPWLALGLLVIVTGGLAPALWLSRTLPVLRFVGGGVAAGLVLGWIAVLGLLAS